jgi:hypothetical protein
MFVSVMHALLSMAWVLLDFVVAGLVIWRFRMTLSSWLVAGGFVFFALTRIMSSLFNWLVMPRMGVDMLAVNVISNGAFTGLYAITCLVVACGVALIPRSLRRLSAARSS